MFTNGLAMAMSAIVMRPPTKYSSLPSAFSR
jgi:hypothetical protein